MTFAGFWVDGAVRKPEARHCDADGLVITRHKETKKLDKLDIGNIEDVDYWLDTTPRESLTPEELFSVLKVAWPHLQCIKKEDDDCWVLGHGYSTHTPIDWGSLTQHPPPVESQWIRITRENVGQYLFCECRLRDGSNEEWRDGYIVGWCIEDECCLVDSDFHPTERILTWNFVEVQNAPTS